MLKVLIVDDEQKEVSFLLRSIAWAEMGLEVVGVAENGKIADDLDQKLLPDIIITDVMMPHVNGTELADRVRQRRTDVHIIFLTGYRSFEYAQAAIKSDVDFYLLKPIDTQQLCQVLSDVSERCVRNKQKTFEQQIFHDMLRENMPALRDAMLRQLLKGVTIEEQRRLQFYDISLKDDHTCVAVLSTFHKSIENEYQRNLNDSQLRIAVQEITDTHSNCLFFPLETTGKYCLILNQCGTHEDIFNLLYSVQQNITLMCRNTVAIGVGTIVYSISNIPESYHGAILALQHCVCDGTNELLFCNDLFPDQYAPSSIWINDLKEKICEQVTSGNLEKTTASLQVFSDYIQSISFSVQMMHTLCIDLTNAVILKASMYYPSIIDTVFGGEVSFIPLMNMTDNDLMIQWVSSVLLKLCNAVSNRQQSRQGLLASEIKAYIDSNLEKDMTVESIASVVSLSRGYASSIFKAQYGIGINQYLLRARMTKAKELLEQPLLKIRDIATMVGFYNNAHFSAVFKREVGLSPREYREKLLDDTI